MNFDANFAYTLLTGFGAGIAAVTTALFIWEYRKEQIQETAKERHEQRHSLRRVK